MTTVCSMPPVSSLEGSRTSVEPYRMDIQHAPSRMSSPLSYPNTVAKSSVLCSSESWNNMLISLFNSWMLEVICESVKRGPKPARALLGYIWCCSSDRWFFCPTSFFLLTVFVLAIILKPPLSWQIPFIIWQGRETLAFSKESWGMWIGWNYRTMLYAKEQYSL